MNSSEHISANNQANPSLTKMKFLYDMVTAALGVASELPIDSSAPGIPTSFEGSLRYYTHGGETCGDDSPLLASATVASMRVIEPGSFCEVDILDLESPITHTATTKWVVEDCDYGSGRTYISFYQCAVTDCSDCFEVPLYSGYLDGDTINQQLEDPHDPSCFSFTGMSAREKDDHDVPTLPEIMVPADDDISNRLFVSDNIDSFSVSQRWDSSEDPADIRKYWDVIIYNACPEREAGIVGLEAMSRAADQPALEDAATKKSKTKKSKKGKKGGIRRS